MKGSSHPAVTTWLARILWRLGFATCQRCFKLTRWAVAWDSLAQPVGPFCERCWPIILERRLDRLRARAGVDRKAPRARFSLFDDTGSSE